MSAGLRFTVITDAGEWEIKTDMRDVIAWERHARKLGLPARQVDGDNTFPQGEYMAYLGWTASVRAGHTTAAWSEFSGQLQGVRISEAAVAEAARASGLPDPTRPDLGAD